MLPLVILGVVAAGIYVAEKGSTMTNLSDVDPENQGGGYDTDYDSFFQAASDNYGVPFALLKAHAIQESSLDPNASRNEPATSSRPASASYGLMQVLWWEGSNRFAKYGYPDSALGGGTSFSAPGSGLYDLKINTEIGAQIIKDNLRACGGNLRDAINMYNTGVKESVREAPSNYVDNVFKYYQTILNQG